MNTKMKRVFSVLAILACIACGGDDELTEAQQLAKDLQIIDNYLSANGIAAQEDPSGLRYVITTLGTGVKPTLSNTVVVKYTGKFFDGSVFDSATSTPATFKLSNLIEAWKIGFQLLPEGSVGTLYVPSGLGYGKSGIGPIPPNANLIFDVELVEVR